ncbi:MAG TPA: hypothetical protein VMI73_01235 [Trebonia sp.]|nr:hypothetical protein [Trebonia sp.]
MDYEVSLTDVTSRPTAVVAAATTWQEFPAREIDRAPADQFPLRSGSVQVKASN